MKDTEQRRLSPAAQNFSEFCEVERERRLNSGEDFDEQIFVSAVQLVLRKLGVDETEQAQ